MRVPSRRPADTVDAALRIPAQTLMGKRTFDRALDHYHTKWSLRNATTADWIACMEEVSGLELKPMARGWLKRPGHPRVTYTTAYSPAARTYTVQVTQAGFPDDASGAWSVSPAVCAAACALAGRVPYAMARVTRMSPLSCPAGADVTGPWEFPIEYSLVKDGKRTHHGVHRMVKAEDTITIADVADAPDFPRCGSAVACSPGCGCLCLLDTVRSSAVPCLYAVSLVTGRSLAPRRTQTLPTPSGSRRPCPTQTA